MSDNKTAWSRIMEHQPEENLKKAMFKSPGEVWVGGEEPSIEVRRRSNLQKKKKKKIRQKLLKTRHNEWLQESHGRDIL